MKATKRHFTVFLPAHVARSVGTIAALVGVGAAVPAALFAEPVAMGVAAGAAAVAAVMGIQAGHEQAERRSGDSNGRGPHKHQRAVGR